MLLGFKGDYMIFPLKKHNAPSELMAAPYVDEAFGAMDPDELSSLEEFSKYICCLYNEDRDEYERLNDVLIYWLEKLLADPLRNGDEVIIPTGSMSIEMLRISRCWRTSSSSIASGMCTRCKQKCARWNWRTSGTLLACSISSAEIPTSRIVVSGTSGNTDLNADA
jgi:hypothetical protein